jgi:hypothetical protein
MYTLPVYKPRPNSRDTPSTIRPSIPGIIAHQVPHTRTCEIRGKKEWNIHKPVSFSLFCLVQRPIPQLGPIHIRCLVWILLRFCYARPPVVHSRAGQGSLLLSFFYSDSPPSFHTFAVTDFCLQHPDFKVQITLLCLI